MHPILLYFVKMLLCSGIFFGYYRLALYNEKFHQWNRFYLMASVFVSILLPLVKIPLKPSGSPTPIITVLDIMPWNQVDPSPSGDMQNYPITLVGVISMITGLVSLFLMVRFLAGIQKIVRSYRRGIIKTLNEDVKLIFTTDPYAPYSFFKWLFWRADVDMGSSAGKRMLLHEITHIKQNHSLDKCLMELSLIVFWMNPFFWFIRKELFTIHEFLADQKAVEQQDGAAFAEMLLQGSRCYPNPILSNPFFTSQIKRRLTMITSNKSDRFSYAKRLLTLCVGLTTIMMIACTTEKSKDIAPPTEIKVVEGFNLFSVKDITDPDLPTGTLIFLDGNPITLEALKKINPNQIAYDALLPKEAAMEKYGATATVGAYELYSYPTTSSDPQPGKEYLPSFPGGKEGWSGYLFKNLRYPKKAIDKGTMGMVKIAFTVTADGTLNDLIILEDPGDGLGKEALRVIAEGPKWVPGRVDGQLTEQRVIMPVTFMLE